MEKYNEIKLTKNKMDLKNRKNEKSSTLPRTQLCMHDLRSYK